MMVGECENSVPGIEEDLLVAKVLLPRLVPVVPTQRHEQQRRQENESHEDVQPVLGQYFLLAHTSLKEENVETEDTKFLHSNVSSIAQGHPRTNNAVLNSAWIFSLYQGETDVIKSHGHFFLQVTKAFSGQFLTTCSVQDQNAMYQIIGMCPIHCYGTQ